MQVDTSRDYAELSQDFFIAHIQIELFICIFFAKRTLTVHNTQR